MRRVALGLPLLAAGGLSLLIAPERTLAQPPDVVVVGAGISGLSAALEATYRGATVTVVDMWSVFGGHAVMSHGAVSIVGTPLQAASGIVDSPALAYRDFVEWGEDADTVWVQYYVHNSRREIYDWLTSMGVQFDSLMRPAGNSVPRVHVARGRGLGLVAPLFRECLQSPAVSFAWNRRVTQLIAEDGRVVGVQAEDLRTGRQEEFRASTVIMATGGFQSNLEMVRTFWPESLPSPSRMLAGSGLHSTGSGHEIVRKAGGILVNMGHQWNYSSGLVDPRDASGYRGLSATNAASIWVNAAGERFVDETAGTKVTFPALLHQESATYWAIFDESSKRRFSVSGSDWGDFETVEDVIFGSNAVKSAPDLETLAEKAGLPPLALIHTVRKYNQMVDRGHDHEFGRFGPSRGTSGVKIKSPPFYAVQFYPLTRKSLGGVRIDHSARVLDPRGDPIPGLYAVGELTGFGGINGSAGLEGTFLGPSIVTGRVAARAALPELRNRQSATQAPMSLETPVVEGPRASTPSLPPVACHECHDISSLIESPRKGYAHFERVHGVVLQRSYECRLCHAELAPYRSDAHHIDRVAQVENCTFCHASVEHGSAE